VKAVFDTNVLVAAVLTEGVCAKLLLRARKRECVLVVSVAILEELERTLGKKFRVSSGEAAQVRAAVAEAASEVLAETDPIAPVCRDPDDDKILACAASADAGFVVTGDADLLVLASHGRTRIVTPREFESLFAD
jgi:uncharacterized protein